MISTKNRVVSAIVALSVLVMSSGLPQAVAAPKPTSINIIPTITSVALVNGVLTATGTATAVIHGRTTTVPFTAPVDITLAPNQPPGVCPVLDLRLGPINLDLLGLVVQTSPICLQITATPGGGLLGDLLCSLGNLLNQGLTLPQALATFTPAPNSLISSFLKPSSPARFVAATNACTETPRATASASARSTSLRSYRKIRI